MRTALCWLKGERGGGEGEIDRENGGVFAAAEEPVAAPGGEAVPAFGVWSAQCHLQIAGYDVRLHCKFTG